MKRLFKVAMLLGVVALFTACGATSHLTSNANLTQTVVELKENNYRVVKMVSGTAKDIYVFGIGGVSRNALAENSYAQMVKNAELKDNQAIINVSTSENVQAYIVYTKREMTTSGVVIEFSR